MNTLHALILAACVAMGSSVSASSYATEATLSLNANKSEYQVFGRVSKLITRGGRVREEVIAQPRVVSSPGAAGSFYAGAERSSRNFKGEINVSMDVFWPEQANGGFAICTITVKRGDTVESKTTMKMRVPAD